MNLKILEAGDCMSGAKEIRSKIISIKKTQKITRAMEMVAASKMRKTQEQMRKSRPYAHKIYEVIKHVSHARSEYRHPFLIARDIKCVGIIVVTTDRGLCGGLNSNLLRETMKHITELKHQGKEVALCVLGNKGQVFFRRVGGKVLAANTIEQPSLERIIGSLKVMLDAFYKQEIDALSIISNEFINTMSQKPVIKPLLPLPRTEDKRQDPNNKYWDYIYEPDAKELLDVLLERYIELIVYQAVVENVACEQAAKMIAMKSATDNAEEFIKECQLIYNKARQAAITKELTEIVGGADAL